jgi:lysylphosphatidylglycerol synthetase-like protein (DUF2156 family)
MKPRAQWARLTGGQRTRLLGVFFLLAWAAFFFLAGLRLWLCLALAALPFVWLAVSLWIYGWCGRHGCRPRPPNANEEAARILEAAADSGAEDAWLRRMRGK